MYTIYLEQEGKSPVRLDTLESGAEAVNNGAAYLGLTKQSMCYAHTTERLLTTGEVSFMVGSRNKKETIRIRNILT